MDAYPAIPQCAHCGGWHFGTCPPAPRGVPAPEFRDDPDAFRPAPEQPARCPHCGAALTTATAGD